MRVLSDNGGRATALVDRAAAGWLSRTSGGEAVRQSELAILRRLVFLSSAALIAAPVGLSIVTSPAVALPAGVATVCAAFLFSRPVLSPNRAGCPVCLHPTAKLRMPLFETHWHLRQICLEF